MVPTASDVGGRKGRKLIFKTDSGIVYIRKMSQPGAEAAGGALVWIEIKEKYMFGCLYINANRALVAKEIYGN